MKIIDLRLVIPAVLVWILAFSWVQIFDHPSEKTSQAIKTGEDAIIIGTISGNLSKSTTNCSVEIQTQTITLNNVMFPENTTLRVFGKKLCEQIQFGNTYRFKGRLNEPNFLYLAQNSDQNTAKTNKDEQNVILVKATDPITAWINQTQKNLQQSLEERAQQLASNPPLSKFCEIFTNASYLSFGLTAGDTHYMETKDLKDLRSSGLAHIVAVSGTHLVIVVGIFLHFLSLLPLSRKIKAVLQIFLAVSFCVFVHSGDSIMRSVFMSICLVLSCFTGRSSFSLSALSACIICYLILDPTKAVSFSFALSVAATAGIIILSPIFTMRMQRVFSEGFAKLLAVPLAAFLSTTPIIFLMTSSIQIYSVLTNLLVGIFILPAVALGVLGLVFLVVTQLGHILLAVLVKNSIFTFVVDFLLYGIEAITAGTQILAIIASSLILLIGKQIAGLPFANLTLPDGVPGFILASLPLIFFVFYSPIKYKITGRQHSFIIRKAERLKKTTAKLCLFYRQRYGKMRICFACLGVLIVPFSLLTIVTYRHISTNTIPEDWVIGVCQVGQGDASLLRTSALDNGRSQVIAIDTGPDPKMWQKCLSDFKIDIIDLLILTHFHADHIGGLSSKIADNIKIKQAWVSPVAPDNVEVRKILTLLEQKKIPYETPKVFDNYKFGITNLTVVSALDNPQVVDYKNLTNFNQTLKPNKQKISAAKLDDAENDSSITVYSSSCLKRKTQPNQQRTQNNQTQCFTGLWTGDLEEQGQKEAFKNYQALGIKKLNLLKVPHHGSKTQNETFAQALHPDLTVYCVGKNNFGHPNPKTIALFEEIGAKTLRTDLGSLGVRFSFNNNTNVKQSENKNTRKQEIIVGQWEIFQK